MNTIGQFAYWGFWMLTILLGLLHIPALWSREWLNRKAVSSVAGFLSVAILTCALAVVFSIVGRIVT